MRPRRGTPWKAGGEAEDYSQLPPLQCGHGGELRGKDLMELVALKKLQASMRPRSRTPWKGSTTVISVVNKSSASMRPRSRTPWKELGLDWESQLRQRARASMRPRSRTPWKGPGYALGNSAFRIGASMRPRSRTPWKGGSSPLRSSPRPHASMRPRRGTPWKAPWSAPGCNIRGSPRQLQCGHGGELRGKQLDRSNSATSVSTLQCGHGGELRGKASWLHCVRPAIAIASMRPRRGTPWKAGCFCACKRVSGGLQCGHGGELRGRPIPRCIGQGWPCFNAATEGNSVEGRYDPDGDRD